MPTIRTLDAADAGVLTALVVANREFLAEWEPVRPEAYFTLDGQREVIAASLRQQSEGLSLPCVILDETDSVVGRINLNNIVRGPFQSASVGYWLAASAGGRGLATLAVAEIIDVAFGEVGLRRLEAGTLPHNFRSQAVLLRNGFRQFGYAERYLAIAGRYQDHVLFQRLDDVT